MAFFPPVYHNDVRVYTLSNQGSGDIIFPVIADTAGKILWNGQEDTSAIWQVQQDDYTSVDISTLKDKQGQPLLKGQTPIQFGVVLQNETTPVYDTKNTFVYKPASKQTVYAVYYSKLNFQVFRAQPNILAPAPEPAEQTAQLQSKIIQQNSPAVAKLLTSLATLVLPEV